MVRHDHVEILSQYCPLLSNCQRRKRKKFLRGYRILTARPPFAMSCPCNAARQKTSHAEYAAANHMAATRRASFGKQNSSRLATPCFSHSMCEPNRQVAQSQRKKKRKESRDARDRVVHRKAVLRRPPCRREQRQGCHASASTVAVLQEPSARDDDKSSRLPER
ncbi:hypothetical protein N658DRAFT_27120 [Parathielavia hyrcaniae]|uniref:Uncharacterized protein n=1 Tax=Parathielavia hyrcaniae TaxID=113614 RepID=A0AAN6T677_9PEZI|nr:hypothetical protein N658DRAFT_27120 [Parathielavia hyrcaniae]